MARIKYVKPLLERLPESMTAEDLDTVLRLDVAGCNAWDIALEIGEEVYTVFRIVVNSEYLRAKAAALKVVAVHGFDDDWQHHFARLAAIAEHRPAAQNA